MWGGRKKVRRTESDICHITINTSTHINTSAISLVDGLQMNWRMHWVTGVKWASAFLGKVLSLLVNGLHVDGKVLEKLLNKAWNSLRRLEYLLLLSRVTCHLVKLLDVTRNMILNGHKRFFFANSENAKH